MVKDGYKLKLVIDVNESEKSPLQLCRGLFLSNLSNYIIFIRSYFDSSFLFIDCSLYISCMKNFVCFVAAWFL